MVKGFKGKTKNGCKLKGMSSRYVFDINSTERFTINRKVTLNNELETKIFKVIDKLNGFKYYPDFTSFVRIAIDNYCDLVLSFDDLALLGITNNDNPKKKVLSAKEITEKLNKRKYSQ